MQDTDNNYYELKQHGSKELPMQLYEGNCNVFMDCYVHWHKEMEIIFVKEGIARVSVNNKVIYGNKGDLIFIEKDAVHFIEGHIDNQSILSYQTLVFDLMLFEFKTNSFCQSHLISPLMKKEIKIRNLIKTTDLNYDNIIALYLKILSTYKSKEEFYQIKIIYLFYELFYELSKGHHIIHIDKSINKNVKAVKACIAYIDKNYKEHIDIDTLSKATNFSQGYLMHLFKNYTGETMITYIQSVRIDKAKEMLSSTNETIDEIAYLTGFENTSYFIKCFKRKTGLTPLKYRKEINN